MGIKDSICILSIFCSTCARADNFLKAGVAGVSSQEVQQQFQTQLSTMLGQGDVASMERLDSLQSQLKPLYLAMPRRSDGGLDHAAARYALHRFFAQQHGWHVRGLDATKSDQGSDASYTAMLEDHIPSYVLQLFEQHHGGRTGLRELAVLAATLEDVVHSEAIQLLSTAYAAQNLSVVERLNGTAEDRILRTYLLFHTLPNPQYAELGTASLNRVLRQAPSFWTAWPDTVLWVRDLRSTMDYDESSAQNPFIDKASKAHDFNSVVRLVEGLGENYGKFQNLECRGMKNALLDLSDGSGRVRLGKFYRAAYEGQKSHFSESMEYLRHLGVLDETDPQQPSVVVTNYMYGRANCVASSSLYSICCLDECEGLMAQLERGIADPEGDPQRIAELVATMASETVSAPRNMSVPLRRRLDDIAGRHGGSIPLHGRLFAQWMHHAFPNECAYPHLSGSLDSPVSPMAWLLAQEHSGPSLKASKDQMQSFVESMSDPLSAAQELRLPWTEEEELMIGRSDVHPFGRVSTWFRVTISAVVVLSAIAALLRPLGAAVLASIVPAKADKGSCLSDRRSSARKLDQQWV